MSISILEMSVDMDVLVADRICDLLHQVINIPSKLGVNGYIGRDRLGWSVHTGYLWK